MVTEQINSNGVKIYFREQEIIASLSTGFESILFKYLDIKECYDHLRITDLDEITEAILFKYRSKNVDYLSSKNILFVIKNIKYVVMVSEFRYLLR